MRARFAVASVALLALAGCGATKTITDTTTTTTSLTFASTSTQVSVSTVRVAATTITSTTTTSITSTKVSTTTALPHPTSSFSGNGSENIGTVNVSQPSELKWSCPSCTSDNFQIGNNPNDSSQITVNALGPTSGQTYLDPGTYHDVSINTEGGAWTINIVPGAS